MMTKQEMIYEEKHLFVKKLEEALLCLDDIRGIEYRASSSKYIELVRIDWHGAGDPHVYIDVTGYILLQVLNEVVPMVLYGRAHWEVRNRSGADELWEELGEELGAAKSYGEDHYGKLPSDAASVMQEVRKRYDELKGEGSYEKELKEFVERRRRPR